ncbi:hypothetical protein ES332_D02G136800v1 [Gossypium tomentosum]|uniref:FAD-binding PCMH-type domain-containing protein n=1 Tax=Gossypium tomentosum TaxID=34277 RepID=A0A5D2LWU3_GOSTO|nr:hypothetical protein ES332_D02G136800v1 [Gossypium tomentosum]
MKDSNSATFQLVTIVLFLSLSWRATSDSSSQVDKFLQCLANNSALMLESIYTPIAIVAPNHVSHVQATVICAKDNGVQIRVRSVGHDYEGLSYRSNVTFVILDMFNLRSIDVDVDVDNEVAFVQAGATIGKLYYKIANESKGHAYPAGVCPSLGTGGHFSGGGKYGLSVDNILDAQVVGADGNILDQASMGEDLFWAIRGGGGASFAVIVSWKIKLVQVPEKVTVFTVLFTLEQGATDVAFKWQQVAPKLPEDLYIRQIASVINGSCPLEKKILVSFMGLFLGEADKLVPLVNQSFPELNLTKEDCKEMSWLESTVYWAGFPVGTPVQVLLNRTQGAPNIFKVKSDVKTVIPKEGLETIWQMLIGMGNTSAANISMQWNPYGGKMSEIPESSTAFPHRSGNLFLIQLRDMYDRMGPFVSKDPREAFLNYRDIDIGSSPSDQTNFTHAQVYGSKYFKDNFQRLTMVKAEMDPSNFFKNEQSIPPNFNFK